jgi:hypothetical protein
MINGDYTDIRVRTGNPEALDETIRHLGGCTAVVVDGSWAAGVCTVRVFSGEGFLRFALTNQGYGEIVESDNV